LGKTRTKGIAIEWLPQIELASNQAIVETYKKFKKCIPKEDSNALLETKI